MDDAKTGGPDLPATMGMERPVLAQILRDAADLAGVKSRFATTVTAFTQDATGVDVDFSDGSRSRYDVMIGADGVRSSTREALGIELETTPTGMGIWRVLCSRPTSITHTDLFYGASVHRRLLPDRPGLDVCLHRRRRAGSQWPHRRPKVAGDAIAGRALSRTVGRHP